MRRLLKRAQAGTLADFIAKGGFESAVEIQSSELDTDFSPGNDSHGDANIGMKFNIKRPAVEAAVGKLNDDQWDTLAYEMKSNRDEFNDAFTDSSKYQEAAFADIEDDWDIKYSIVNFKFDHTPNKIVVDGTLYIEFKLG